MWLLFALGLLVSFSFPQIASAQPSDTHPYPSGSQDSQWEYSCPGSPATGPPCTVTCGSLDLTGKDIRVTDLKLVVGSIKVDGVTELVYFLGGHFTFLSGPIYFGAIIPLSASCNVIGMNIIYIGPPRM
jgi:hypothetical protein